MRTALLRMSGKGPSDTLSYLFPPTHVSFFFFFLIQMCCFCQITEIRSVWHLQVWSLKQAPSVPLAVISLYCHQQLHFLLHYKLDAAGGLTWVRHWVRVSLISSSQCHEQKHQDLAHFPCSPPALRYSHSAGRAHNHWYNYDEGNHFISAYLSYLTLQKSSHDLDTESVPAEFNSKTLIDFNMYISPFLIGIVIIYSWHNSWWSSLLKSLLKKSHTFPHIFESTA